MGTRMLNVKQIITERLIKYKFFKTPVISHLFLSSCQHTPEQSIKFYKDPVISGANIQLSRLKAGMHLGVIFVWLMMCSARGLIDCLEAYLERSQTPMMALFLLNSKQEKTFNYFRKKALSDMFDWFSNTLLFFFYLPLSNVLKITIEKPNKVYHRIWTLNMP